MKKEKLNCDKAKKISITSVLRKEGILPVRENSSSATYLSVLRIEKTASMRVDKKLNLWIDYGSGKRGTIIDLMMFWKNLSISEALRYLNENATTFSFHQQNNNIKVMENKIKINKVIDIQHFGLIHYLENRRIPVNIARAFCKEVHYSTGNHNYFGIGFKNNSEGWELRNKYFKSASSPKDITIISNENKTVLIFEGFMDFLSHRVIFPDQNDCDFIISNSTALIKKITNQLEEYKEVELWLDNDDSGKKASNHVKSIFSNVTDMSSFYSEKKDLNEWMMSNKTNTSE